MAQSYLPHVAHRPSHHGSQQVEEYIYFWEVGRYVDLESEFPMVGHVCLR